MKNVKFQGDVYAGYDVVVVTENGVQCPKCANVREQEMQWSILKHALFPEMENCTYLILCKKCELRYGFTLSMNTDPDDCGLEDIAEIIQ